MNRGEIWLAEAGGKTRPVLVLTRQEVIDVRQLVTVSEVTTSIRGISVEVAIDPVAAGLKDVSVINCDGLHTFKRSSLTQRIGVTGDTTMAEACEAVGRALGC